MFARCGKHGLALLFGALLATACDDSNPLGSNGEARLSVKLTDAPGDLAEANVKVEKIIFIRDADGEGEGSDRVEFTPASTGWIDLLTLDNGQVEDLITETIAPGTYQQVRVIVCEAYIETTDGDVIATPGATLPVGVTATPGAELKLTSQCKSGFKVNFQDEGLTVTEGSNTLVVDFDVNRSFIHEAGKSGKWVVTPVLHGFTFEETAKVTGTVTLQNITLPLVCGGESLTQELLLGKFIPNATVGTTVRTGSTTGATGAFSIANLLAGSYTLGLETVTFSNGDKLAFTATATPSNLSLTAGSTVTANYVVTAATCTPPAV